MPQFLPWLSLYDKWRRLTDSDFDGISIYSIRSCLSYNLDPCFEVLRFEIWAKRTNACLSWSSLGCRRLAVISWVGTAFGCWIVSVALLACLCNCRRRTEGWEANLKMLLSSFTRMATIDLRRSIRLTIKSHVWTSRTNERMCRTYVLLKLWLMTSCIGERSLKISKVNRDQATCLKLYFFT